jgi:MFS family permease
MALTDAMRSANDRAMRIRLRESKSAAGETATTERAKRPRIFYGWVLVVVTILDGAFSSGAGVWGFSVFVQPMGEELGWSRAAIYGALTVRSLASGCLAPFIGPLQDTRNGPRILAVITTLTLCASMFAMYLVSDLIVFYILFGCLGALASFGSSDMMMTAVLPKWFIRKRGRALATGSIGTAMGPLFFPLLVSFLLTLFDWRGAWLALGAITLAIMGPASLLVRTRPEDVGLLPDGGPDTSQAGAPAGRRARRADLAPSDHDFTRKEVVRTRTFWLLALAFSLGTLGTGGFFSNWLPYFRDLGFTSAEGSLAATAYGICSISMRAVWGWVTDRYPVRFALFVQCLLTGLSVVGFFLITDQITLVLAGAANGLAVGGFFILRPLTVANYFGRGHLGSINGIIRPFTTIAAATSPLIVAALYDFSGSYRMGFGLVAVCWFVAACAVVLARPPRPPAVAMDAKLV